MLSTPVCGVETKKETVEPLDAPLDLRVAATGITPHEHRGRGIPKRVALKIELKFFVPICFKMKLSFTKIEIRPDISIPINRNGLISRIIVQDPLQNKIK